MICENCGKEHDGLYGSGRFCCKSCANTRHHSKETKEKISKGVFHGHHSLFYEKLTTYRICPICNTMFLPKITSNNKISNAVFCSNDCYRKNISLRNKGKTGGYFEGTTKSYKHGTYKGIYCDSSWELAFVIYYLDNNLYIQRNKEYKLYTDENNIVHKFYPDFITNEGLIEIKGKQDKNYIYKQQANKDVKFLFKEDIQFYIDYCINKYGKDYIKLYE